MCPGTQRDRGQKRNGARVFQGRATASARFSGVSRGEGRGGGIGKSWFFRHTSTNEYIRVIFFYSLPTSDIYIYGYIYIAARSVCFMAYTGKGECELEVTVGRGRRGGGNVCVCVCVRRTAREPWDKEFCKDKLRFVLEHYLEVDR